MRGEGRMRMRVMPETSDVHISSAFIRPSTPLVHDPTHTLTTTTTLSHSLALSHAYYHYHSHTLTTTITLSHTHHSLPHSHTLPLHTLTRIPSHPSPLTCCVTSSPRHPWPSLPPPDCHRRPPCTPPSVCVCVRACVCVCVCVCWRDGGKRMRGLGRWS